MVTQVKKSNFPNGPFTDFVATISVLSNYMPALASWQTLKIPIELFFKNCTEAYYVLFLRIESENFALISIVPYGHMQVHFGPTTMATSKIIDLYHTICFIYQSYCN